MQLEFKDETLERLFCEPDFVPDGWDEDMTRASRRVIDLLRSTRDERDLHNLRTLRFEAMPVKRKRTCSVRLNERKRLIFRLEGDVPNTVIVVLEAVEAQ